MSEGNKKCAAQSAAGQMEWLLFPTLGRMFDSDLASPIGLLAQKIQQLRSQMEVGPPAERARARLRYSGYRHTLALLREMRQVKNELAGQQAQDRRSR